MKVQAPFGFVTGCHAGDKFLVKATLASMRYYCPNVPICLTVDGDFDVSDLQDEYGLHVLRISDLSSNEMRSILGGSWHAKMAAMWEGPFEFYVWMDSDAIVWGDITKAVLRTIDFQIFWNEITSPRDAHKIPSWLPHLFFDPAKLNYYDPIFNWRGNYIFCAGVYACRRGVISFNEYKRAYYWGERTPNLFAWGDQGILNYLVHSKIQKGEIKAVATNTQHICSHPSHGIHEVEADLKGSGWTLPNHILRPRIVHFCVNGKPLTYNWNAYTKPFTLARLEHYRRIHGTLLSWMKIFIEDFLYAFNKVKLKIARQLGI